MDRTDRDDDAPGLSRPSVNRPSLNRPRAHEQNSDGVNTHAENERDDVTARVARFKAMQQRLTRAREDEAKMIWDNRLGHRRQSRA